MSTHAFRTTAPRIPHHPAASHMQAGKPKSTLPSVTDVVFGLGAMVFACVAIVALRVGAYAFFNADLPIFSAWMRLSG